MRERPKAKRLAPLESRTLLNHGFQRQVIGDREVLVELENFSLREQPGYNSRGTKDLLHWKDKNISKVLDLPRSLHETLFHHQLEGVQWLWGLHNNTAVTGGILGDDMGLGKTIQVTSLLVGLIRMGLIRNVLIVAPISVLESWEREINSHLRPNVLTLTFELDLYKVRQIAKR